MRAQPPKSARSSPQLRRETKPRKLERRPISNRMAKGITVPSPKSMFCPGKHCACAELILLVSIRKNPLEVDFDKLTIHEFFKASPLESNICAVHQSHGMQDHMRLAYHRVRGRHVLATRTIAKGEVGPSGRSQSNKIARLAGPL